MPTAIEILPWNEKFATGIAVIDEQHRKLIALLNTLVVHLVFQSEAPEVDRIIHALKDYAAFHFETEEGIWHQHFQGDPWELSHQCAHAEFVDQIIRLNGEKSHKPLDEVIEGIVTFLTHWLAVHIIESDRRMAKAVLALPSGSSLEQAKKMADDEMSGTTRMLIETVMTMYDRLAIQTVRMTREIFKREQTELALRQTQQELRTSMDVAVAANLSKADFLAKISHDLRTPLARLRLETELSVVDPEARANMAADITQLDAIIGKFLEYARPGKAALENVVLKEIIDACLFSVRNRTDMRIKLELEDDLRVLADGVELGRVLSNLIENAGRYGKSVDTGLADLHIAARASGKWVLIRVRDHGIGVPTEQLPQLTKPFYRGEVARTAANGAGLGLAIVESTIARMGGSFGLNNSSSGGLVANIRLQRAETN